MEHNFKVFTSGTWMVKSGKQEEFIREWTAFATWTFNNVDGAEGGHLLKVTTDENKFISFGSWKSEAIIQEWRNSDRFKNFIVKIKELCDDYKVITLNEVASSTMNLAGTSA